MRTHNFGPFYVQSLYWVSRKHLPFSIEHTQETEDPYRAGTCLVLGVPGFKRAVALGVWREKKWETEALLDAVGGHLVNGVPSYADDLI